MANSLDPGLVRDLVEAKAALARHGIVIIRAIETELEPALMAAVKSSMASNPSLFAKMDEEELDAFVGKMRNVSMKTANELKGLYIRLLGKLGTEYVGELAKELEGIGQLFTWERVSKSVEPVNSELSEKGFRPVELKGPESLSESFELELEQKWPPAFDRFKALVTEAEKQIEKEGSAAASPVEKKRGRKAQKRG